MSTSRTASPVVSRNSGDFFRIRVLLLLLVVALQLASTSCETKIYRDGADNFTLDSRIIEGNLAVDGDWPWHGALFVGNDYKCGCSLISEWFVLTAGHCLFNPDTGYKFDTGKLRIVLGVLNLDQRHTHGQEFQVKEINVYPEFTAESHRHDLALLLLSEAVVFSEKIRPIEVDDSKSSFIEKLAGNYGTVVGWGFTEEAKVSNQLMVTQMLIARYIDCIESKPYLFGQLLHTGMYCARAENGTNVCNGDSGGGMYVFKQNSWYLGGIVSFAALQDGTNLCDVYSYAGFTNVPHYVDWIRSQLQEHQRKMQEDSEHKDISDEAIAIRSEKDTPTTTTTQPISATTIQSDQPLESQPIRETPSEHDKIVRVEYNSSISLVCNHGSEGANGELQRSTRWFRETKHLHEIDLSNEIGFTDSGVLDNLTLRQVDASHSGRYYCRSESSSANVTDRRIVSVLGAVPRFDPVAGSPAYMKYEVFLNQQYFSLQVTFKADREEGVLFYRSDELDHQIMMLALVNGTMDLGLLTESKVIRKIDSKMHRISIDRWHTVNVKCYLGRCYFALDGKMLALFYENLFVTNSRSECIYLGGIPGRNESGFSGCISQMVLNDYPINLRKEVVRSERVSKCNHCTVNTCQNGGVCVETMDRDAFRCLCPDGFTGRYCSNSGERCLAMSCVESLCKDFENGFRCACSPTRTGRRCEEMNNLNGRAISFRSFGYAKYS
ncbi:AAEL013413-PA [Aedes aegypti]|uniref:AAEL013413-PA n=1 Tax=Aedes aegypti TaxID=7159 RepID=Q16J82_AEDAE|nr:AAEL013413-PA [Aedes aegypti]